MKKSIYVLMTLLCFTSIVNAQTLHTIHDLTFLNDQNALSPMAKTQTVKYRIIGARGDSYAGGVWTSYDSITLSYTGTRGENLPLYFYYSDYPEYNLEFDEEYDYQFDGTIWVKNTKDVQTYDANDLTTSATHNEWDGALFNPDYRTLFTYNPDQTRATQENQNYTGGVWENSNMTQYTYDAGKLNYFIYKTWSAGVYENSTKKFYVYDAVTGQPTVITSQSWTGSDWQNDYRFVISYNVLNQITQEVYQYWDGVSWVESSKYTYEYDVNNQLYVTTEYSSGVIYGRIIYTYDATFHLDQILYQSYDLVDGYVNSSRTSLDFSGEGDGISYVYFEDWDGSVFVPSSRSYYYTESFDDGIVQVDNIVATGGTCIVYPQPASSEVRFALKDMQTSAMDITISDMNGRILTVKHAETTDGIVTLKASEIPQSAGIYVWSMITREGAHHSGKLIIN